MSIGTVVSWGKRNQLIQILFFYIVMIAESSNSILSLLFFAYSVVVVKIVADVCGAHPAVTIRVCVCMRVHGLFDRTYNN